MANAPFMRYLMQVCVSVAAVLLQTDYRVAWTENRLQIGQTKTGNIFWHSNSNNSVLSQMT